MRQYLFIGLISIVLTLSGVECFGAERISKEEVTRLATQNIENTQAIVSAIISGVLTEDSKQLINVALACGTIAREDNEYTEAYIHSLESIIIMKRSGVKHKDIPKQQISLSKNSINTCRKIMEMRLKHIKQLLYHSNVDNNEKKSLKLLMRYYTGMLSSDGALAIR